MRKMSQPEEPQPSMTAPRARANVSTASKPKSAPPLNTRGRSEEGRDGETAIAAAHAMDDCLTPLAAEAAEHDADRGEPPLKAARTELRLRARRHQ
jgi:hypothetical protein